jgi:hypothetical protein
MYPDKQGQWDILHGTKVQLLLPTHCKHTGGSRDLAALTTSSLYRGEWSTSHPVRFTPRKEPQFPLNRRLGGLQSRSERFEEEKTSCPYRDSNTGRCSPEPSCYSDYANPVPSSIVGGAIKWGPCHWRPHRRLIFYYFSHRLRKLSSRGSTGHLDVTLC